MLLLYHYLCVLVQFTGQLMDKSLASCSHLQNPLRVSGVPLHEKYVALQEHVGW